MGVLSDLALRPTYHKVEDDVARSFYLPCMACAVNYDRAVGFFSSSIYVLAWSALKQFVQRGGRMRLICSPVLSPGDAEALVEGHDARFEEAIAASMRAEVQRLLRNPFVEKPARVLASLVAINVIDLKIAFVRSTADGKAKRLFHDKLGLFIDPAHNVVAFKGSMNETWAGLSNDGNLESVDVFVSWETGREHERVQAELSYFETLWNDRYPKVTVRDFPSVAREELLNSADPDNWPLLVDEISSEIELAIEQIAAPRRNARAPKPHQLDALRAWREQGRRGILEHATGSGKTFTALCAMREAFARNEVPLVLVPSDLLLNQWEQEIHQEFADVEPRLLLCGSGHAKWRTSSLLRPWTKSRDGSPRAVIATMQTASSSEFQRNLSSGDHLFVVADEVHAAGSARRRILLSIPTGARLGLSATPRRAGDAEGTQLLLDYFGAVVQPPFTLRDAIEAGVLSPYMYHVHTVRFTNDEEARWQALTDRISQLSAIEQSPGNKHQELGRKIEQLLIDRARIAKGAAEKANIAVNILRSHFEHGQQWIVYCDSQSQLSEVKRRLSASGIEANEYHSAMRGDRVQTLRYFETHGGVLLSIRCLDEGVDIPTVTHGLILASSKNPREFIQRRGRLLRRVEGKLLAHLHDVLVLPTTLDASNPAAAIVEGELLRAIEFGLDAVNPGAVADLRLIAARFGITSQVLNSGLEEDDAENHNDAEETN